MVSVIVPMRCFNGQRIYGKVSNQKLTLWLTADLYSEVYEHVLAYLPHHRCGLPYAGMDYNGMVKTFIHSWLVAIASQECDWEVNDTVPEFSIPLAQWQKICQHELRGVTHRVITEEVSEVLPGPLGPTALIVEDQALDLSVKK